MVFDDDILLRSNPGYGNDLVMATQSALASIRYNNYEIVKNELYEVTIDSVCNQTHYFIKIKIKKETNEKEKKEGFVRETCCPTYIANYTHNKETNTFECKFVPYLHPLDWNNITYKTFPITKK